MGMNIAFEQTKTVPNDTAHRVRVSVLLCPTLTGFLLGYLVNFYFYLYILSVNLFSSVSFMS